MKAQVIIYKPGQRPVKYYTIVEIEPKAKSKAGRYEDKLIRMIDRKVG